MEENYNIYKIKCKGRDHLRKIVLDTPVEVEVGIYQRGDHILNEIKCSHMMLNEHDHCCDAATKNKSENRLGRCAYAVNLPNLFDDINTPYSTINRNIFNT